ncbi:MAG: hypothetical protein OK457_00830 [Thaumarchaeota archaeon]|nr:hypothetical protein [Nitrososphaerota archaeon]
MLSAGSSSSVNSDLDTFPIFPAIRVIYGLIFGIVFAAAVNKFLLTSSFLLRGVIFGLVLGSIGMVLNLVALSGGATGLVENVLIGIVSSIFFGFVLGYSYGKLGKEHLRS